MIILSDSNNNVVGSYVAGTTVTDLSGITALPTPEQQVGKTARLVIDPATQTLSYAYDDRPLTEAEQVAQTASNLAAIQTTLTATQDAVATALGV